MIISSVSAALGGLCSTILLILVPFVRNIYILDVHLSHTEGHSVCSQVGKLRINQNARSTSAKSHSIPSPSSYTIVLFLKNCFSPQDHAAPNASSTICALSASAGAFAPRTGRANGHIMHKHMRRGVCELRFYWPNRELQLSELLSNLLETQCSGTYTLGSCPNRDGGGCYAGVCERVCSRELCFKSS